ncbi:MAG: hypothetical protein JWR09_5594 [Mucilaginibacter sp.]|nr:hypothetical protein [Mucilaginibacter sp.]
MRKKEEVFVHEFIVYFDIQKPINLNYEMLQADLNPVTRKWAIALFILNLIRIGVCFVTYFQTKYQLVSPLIPKEIILDIIAPYMLIGLVSVLLTIVAFALYAYSKFTFAIIICLLSLAFAQLYFYFL